MGFFADYGGSLISYAVQFVAVTLLSGVLTRILGRAVFGGKITVGEAWQLTRSRVPTLFGLVAISALLFLVPLGLIVALFVALSLSGADVLAVAVVGVLATVGFFVYAAFVTTRLALSASVAVLERRGVIDSLRRSWHLVTGGSWRTFGILILTVIITGLISLVISAALHPGRHLHRCLGEGSTGPQVITAVLLAIGGTVGAMITYPFQAAVNGLLYADRRMRAEAFDLVLQTAAIEQQRQGWVPRVGRRPVGPVRHARRPRPPGIPVRDRRGPPPDLRLDPVDIGRGEARRAAIQELLKSEYAKESLVDRVTRTVNQFLDDLLDQASVGVAGSVVAAGHPHR